MASSESNDMNALRYVENLVRLFKVSRVHDRTGVMIRSLYVLGNGPLFSVYFAHCKLTIYPDIP